MRNGGRTACGLVIVACCAIGASETPPSEQGRLPEIRVDASGFNAREADIRAVLESAGRELWRHFPEYRIEPIVVVRGTAGPITLFERNPRREIVVQLSADGNRWCQYAYQFAHEFCHVLCNAERGDKSNQWFEESICEVASLYAMRGMARTWQNNPPYPNWRDYRDSLREYADATMQKWPYVEEIVGRGMPAFYAKHEAQLRKNPIDRDLNGSVAVVLLPMFEKQPEHWEAVRWLNANQSDAVRSFEAYLSDWHSAVPEAHKPFVARIAAAFGKTVTGREAEVKS